MPSPAFSFFIAELTLNKAVNIPSIALADSCTGVTKCSKGVDLVNIIKTASIWRALEGYTYPPTANICPNFQFSQRPTNTTRQKSTLFVNLIKSTVSPQAQIQTVVRRDMSTVGRWSSAFPFVPRPQRIQYTSKIRRGGGINTSFDTQMFKTTFHHFNITSRVVGMPNTLPDIRVPSEQYLIRKWNV